jgi:hypothetical protein
VAASKLVNQRLGMLVVGDAAAGSEDRRPSDLVLMWPGDAPCTMVQLSIALRKTLVHYLYADGGVFPGKGEVQVNDGGSYNASVYQVDLVRWQPFTQTAVQLSLERLQHHVELHPEYLPVGIRWDGMRSVNLQE